MSIASFVGEGFAEQGGEVVLADLADPSGIAVRRASSGGGVQVLTIDSGRVLSTLWQEGRSAEPTVLIDDIDEQPAALGWLSSTTLLVASGGVAAYELGDRDGPR
ncbi:MAG: hypothetical protein AAF266_10615, partial [Planctomycetota bacterium]